MRFILPIVIFAILIWRSYEGSECRFYKHIGAIRHPTAADYRTIQNHLHKGKRPLLHHLKDCTSKARHVRLIGRRLHEVPQYGRVVVNVAEEDRDCCLLLYASYNKNYPAALYRLLERIKASDYRGHILFRIGGWPNAEEGDLLLSRVPYAFKVCFFREAERLGYKKAFWLDTSVVPLISLNDCFARIAERGYLAVGNVHTVGPFFNKVAAKALKISLEESFSIPSISAGILGFDFSHALAQEALHRWYIAAKETPAFFSARPEQNALSVIFYTLGMTDWIPVQRMAQNMALIEPDSLFVLDRHFAYTTTESQVAISTVE